MDSFSVRNEITMVDFIKSEFVLRLWGSGPTRGGLADIQTWGEEMRSVFNTRARTRVSSCITSHRPVTENTKSQSTTHAGQKWQDGLPQQA